MRYMLIVHEGPEGFAVRNHPEQGPALFAAIEHYLGALREAGVFVTGAGLLPPSSGASVRHVDGRRLVQDGPVSDAKEQVGGFFIIDVADMETALAWAARCPSTPSRVVEVRPTLERE